jgi:hypothetical protein
MKVGGWFRFFGWAIRWNSPKRVSSKPNHGIGQLYELLLLVVTGVFQHFFNDASLFFFPSPHP